MSLDQPVTGVNSEGTDRVTEYGGEGWEVGEQSGKLTPMKSVQTAHPALRRDGLCISQFS